MYTDFKKFLKQYTWFLKLMFALFYQDTYIVFFFFQAHLNYINKTPYMFYFT